MLKFTIFILIFSSIGLIGSQLLPLVLSKLQRRQDKKVEEATKQLETLFLEVNKEKIALFYAFSPIILGVAGFLLFHNLPFALLGAGLGLALPTFAIKMLEARRRQRFQAQLVDGIMMLSSSLKGGLSFLQAIEVLVEDMPAPICQEFGLILRENKMGIALDESLKRLNARMKMAELELLINSILVAKETGGDLTRVLSRLSATIRDNVKLKESVKTLTLQGNIQGVVMSILPIVFTVAVLNFNPRHFDIMFHTEIGGILLVTAVFLQITGIVLIRKFSKIDI